MHFKAKNCFAACACFSAAGALFAVFIKAIMPLLGCTQNRFYALFGCTQKWVLLGHKFPVAVRKIYL